MKNNSPLISIEALFGRIFTYYFVVYALFGVYFLMSYPFYKTDFMSVAFEPFQYYPILAYDILFPATLIVVSYYIYKDYKNGPRSDL
jgi:hypothetical protein